MSKHQVAADQNTQVLSQLGAQNALAVAPPHPSQVILATDIVIPKLLLMQGLSEFVDQRKARPGDIVRSSTVEALADPEARIDFVPLKITMGWAEKERIGQKFEFRKAFPRTAENELLPWSFWRNPQGHDFDKPGQMGATEWQRVKSIDVYALLPEDIDDFAEEMKECAAKGEIPDLSKTVLPVVISFRSTSFNAGKEVTTFFAKVDEMVVEAAKLGVDTSGIVARNYTLSLGCKPTKNDKGSFFVFEVGQPKKLDLKYRAQATKWFNTLNTIKDIKVDDSGEAERVQEGGQY